MHPSVAPAPSDRSPSFAGLLASLTAPALKPVAAESEDGLEDDVATLSYERALRSHSRYRAADAGDRTPLQNGVSEQVSNDETTPGDAKLAESLSAAQCPATETASPPLTPAPRNLKRASVTIRLSEAECLQLRARAAESGLTVSAYLRSCTFEAESLRAQVKEALAQLRAPAPAVKPALTVTAQRSWFPWLTRFRPRTQVDWQAARK